MTSVRVSIPNNVATDLINKYISPLVEEYQGINDSEKLSWLQYRRIPTDEKISADRLPLFLTDMITKKINTSITDYLVDKEIYSRPELYIIFPGWRPVAEKDSPVISEVELPWINWKRSTILDLCEYKKIIPFLESKHLVTAMKEIQSQMVKFTELEEIVSLRMKPAIIEPGAMIAIYNIVRYMLLLTYKLPMDLFLEFVSILVKHIDDNFENMDEPLILYQTIIIALGCEQIEHNLMEAGTINNKTKITYTDVCNAYYKNSYWNFGAFILPPSSWEDIIPPDEVVMTKSKQETEDI